MQIFIMRHGQANPQGTVDELRPLNEEGVAEVNTMAQWFSEEHNSLDYIIVSPFVRAQQTKKLFTANNLSQVPNESVELITPFGDVERAHDYIRAIIETRAIKKLLIISHMPLVSFLTAELTHDQNAPIFQTAAVLEIEYDIHNMSGDMTQLTVPADFN